MEEEVLGKRGLNVGELWADDRGDAEHGCGKRRKEKRIRMNTTLDTLEYQRQSGGATD